MNRSPRPLPDLFRRGLALLLLVGWCVVFVAGSADGECVGEEEHADEIEHVVYCVCVCVCHHFVSTPENINAAVLPIGDEGECLLDDDSLISTLTITGIFRPPEPLA